MANQSFLFILFDYFSNHELYQFRFINYYLKLIKNEQIKMTENS